MFRNVPACSGMFRVPGFIDGRLRITKDESLLTSLFTLFLISVRLKTKKPWPNIPTKFKN